MCLVCTTLLSGLPWKHPGSGWILWSQDRCDWSFKVYADANIYDLAMYSCLKHMEWCQRGPGPGVDFGDTLVAFKMITDPRK
jgi:hypothetical protein